MGKEQVIKSSSFRTVILSICTHSSGKCGISDKHATSSMLENLTRGLCCPLHTWSCLSLCIWRLVFAQTDYLKLLNFLCDTYTFFHQHFPLGLSSWFTSSLKLTIQNFNSVFTSFQYNQTIALCNEVAQRLHLFTYSSWIFFYETPQLFWKNSSLLIKD